MSVITGCWLVGAPAVNAGQPEVCGKRGVVGANIAAAFPVSALKKSVYAHLLANMTVPTSVLAAMSTGHRCGLQHRQIDGCSFR